MMQRPESTDMGTASKRRLRVRPMSIAAFGEKILDIYKPTASNKNYTTYYRVRRVVIFITNHPSVKTTADLTTPLISEFAGSCGDISESTRVTTLKHFRRICNLAIEWGCLKRNPFEGYPLPKTPSRSFARVPRGRELDEEQVRSILAHLKAGADTWKGHRLYAFTATIIYAGLQTSEALELKCADCDFSRREIRVPRRANFSWSMHSPVVKIPPILAEILTTWFARRMQGKPDWATQIRYGTVLANDGRTLILDEAEQSVLADMRRWQIEGWSLKRIARELDSRGIPTKLGRSNKWSPGSVDVILKREGKLDSNIRSSASDDNEREGSDSEADPGWIFPNVSGKSRWQRTDSPGYTPLDQLRKAGAVLGIERLTFQSLRRFYLERTQPAFALGGGNNELSEQPEVVPSPAGKCPLDLRGPGSFPIVGKDEIRIDLTAAEYAILVELVAGWKNSQGFTYQDLSRMSKIEAPRKVIEGMFRKPAYSPIVAMIHKSGGRPQIVRLISPPSPR